MVKHLIFGKPFPTKTILFPIEPTSSYPNLTVNENDGYDLTYPLRKQTRIFGLGEATGPLNKRGMFKVSLNSDTAHHEDDNYSLYSSHNFLLLEGDDHLGIFVDSPARVVFDLGHSDPDCLKIHSDHPFSLYLIEGESSEAICHEFRSLIGESYVPPLWGFGYGQSRFSYFSQSEVLKVARKYRKHQLPLDYICLDIHYMDHFEDFTFDKDKFPDVPALTSELAESYGVHIVPIVDAGIKVKQGSPAYEEGVKGGYFVTNKEGLPFQAKVWPGMTHFVDFLKAELRPFEMRAVHHGRNNVLAKLALDVPRLERSEQLHLEAAQGSDEPAVVGQQLQPGREVGIERKAPVIAQQSQSKTRNGPSPDKRPPVEDVVHKESELRGIERLQQPHRHGTDHQGLVRLANQGRGHHVAGHLGVLRTPRSRRPHTVEQTANQLGVLPLHLVTLRAVTRRGGELQGDALTIVLQPGHPFAERHGLDLKCAYRLIV